jgi:hypothetical protein
MENVFSISSILASRQTSCHDVQDPKYKLQEIRKGVSVTHSEDWTLSARFLYRRQAVSSHVLQHLIKGPSTRPRYCLSLLRYVILNAVQDTRLDRSSCRRIPLGPWFDDDSSNQGAFHLSFGHTLY